MFDSFFDLQKALYFYFLADLWQISELVDIISMDDFMQILATPEINKLTPTDLNGMSLQVREMK